MGEEEKRLHRACFTGHRPEKLREPEAEVRTWLKEQIETAVRDGFVTFITGMAMGVDIWAGETVLEMKKTHPELHLIAVTPYPTFAARWKADWKARYDRVWRSADYRVAVCPAFEQAAFRKRDEWMVDHCSRVIVWYNGEEGGTKSTIDYANRKGITVVLHEQPPEKEASEKESPARESAEKKKAVSEVPLPSDRRSVPWPGNFFLDALKRPREAAEIPEKRRAAWDAMNGTELAEALIASVRSLDTRDLAILYYRYRDGMTLEQIGQRYGLSRERIRQLLVRALRRIGRLPDPELRLYLLEKYGKDGKEA